MSDRPRPNSPIRVGKLRSTPKGRTVNSQALQEVQQLLRDAPRRRDLLIEHLHKIQDRFGCLADRHLVALAHEMKLAMTEVYEVATFYHHFDVVKDGDPAPPPVTVRVCDSLACELAGGKELLERLPSLLGKGVRVIPAPCIGRCEQAPAATVGQHPVPSADLIKIEALVSRGDAKHPAARDRAQFAPDSLIGAGGSVGALRDVNPDYVGYDAYRQAGGYRLIAECLAGKHDPEAIIQKMEHSGLRGLGGAGFPSGRKWRIVRAEPQPKVVAVNIDEGEPGTFKDRVYLERDPHRFLEGMLIGAHVVQASDIYIYLRDEYPASREILEREIAKLPAGGPKLHMRRGAGAYICGEESSLLESLEGKRGLPRHKPPYPFQVGLFGLPTLINNIETLWWVRDIVEKGAGWWKSHGRNGRQGLRSYSVSGRVKNPGVKLAPAGITVRELIDEFCGGMADGHTLQAYLPGGASGGILPASMDDIALDFGTLEKYGCFIGSAAIIILSEQDSVKAAALNLMRFFEDESCGQCTPCRVGTQKAALLMEKPVWNRELLDELSQVMRDASICGLGQAASNPLTSVIKYFPEEFVPNEAAE